VLNDDRLTLGDGGKMMLDKDLFLVGMVSLEEKKVLVWSDQASTTKGKNVVMSDELRNRMMVPRNPEVSVWKENISRRYTRQVRPTSAMLIEKYLRQQQEERQFRTSGVRRERSPPYQFMARNYVERNTGGHASQTRMHYRGGGGQFSVT
jgi:hypothetical protein